MTGLNSLYRYTLARKNFRGKSVPVYNILNVCNIYRKVQFVLNTKRICSHC